MLSRPRLENLLAGMAGRRILVIGDAMLDVYLRGDAERISPEAPVPVVRVRERKLALGGAANVANNVAAAGAVPLLVAVTGRDEAGTLLRSMLRAVGDDSGLLVSDARPTTCKTRVVARVQQMVRFDEEEDGELGGDERQWIIDRVSRLISDGKVEALVLEDYNKGVLSAPVIERSIAVATARRVPVVVDPKYHNFFAFRGATVFKPNRRELAAALGPAMKGDGDEALKQARETLGVGSLLLTLGERGMVLVDEGGRVSRIPAAAREVYDVVGAGDTVTAYLASAMAAGASPIEAALVANLAAGVEVGKLGAATVTGAEVLAAFGG
ncbi:MAG: bifunctional heptose 7-phosphate kinase/heptose 1-phosphate adenyltransferase [Gemmatimonadota bacterium]